MQIGSERKRQVKNCITVMKIRIKQILQAHALEHPQKHTRRQKAHLSYAMPASWFFLLIMISLSHGDSDIVSVCITKPYSVIPPIFITVVSPGFLFHAFASLYWPDSCLAMILQIGLLAFQNFLVILTPSS